jgi:hypothetical protein
MAQLAPALLDPSSRPPAAPLFVPARAFARSVRAAKAVAEALFSSADGPPPAERIEWLGRELQLFLDRAGWRASVFYRLGLWMVSLVAPLFIRRLGPLRTLSVPLRISALNRMERSAVASAVLGVKAILCIIYYEHPDAARELGYRLPEGTSRP